MSQLHLPIPGSVFGPYPEREKERAPAWGNATRLAPSVFTRLSRRRFLHKLRSLIGNADHQAIGATLAHQEATLNRLELEGFTPEMAALVLLRIGNASRLELGLAPSEQQYLTAWVILNNGLAELGGGEGKTLAVAMAACAAALTGIPVHVFTANDYLAERDAAAMSPLFEHFGLKAARVTQLLSFEQRRRAYRADVCYCTAREVGFDYLRDLATQNEADGSAYERSRKPAEPGARALRGLCMAIVDDADCTLIDEARSPMTISRPAPSGASLTALENAMACARRLEPDRHYRLDMSVQNVQLSPEGKARLGASAIDSAAHWRNPRQREELVDLALYANHLLVRNRDYIVQDNTIALIDPTTGEADAGREWNRGLIQMLALKEGVAPPPINETVAQMSLQSLVSRYHWLGGAGACLSPARLELAVLYGLRVTRVSGPLSARLTILGTRVFSQRFMVWRHVAQRVKELQGLGRPVLIATDSLADAEAVSAVLAKNALRSQILQGRQDGLEHSAIARAGRPFAVTIAAQAAGRGTHIEPGAGVAGAGGLQVICCSFAGVRRTHRHWLDRTARRGQPGAAELLLCLDQGLLAKYLPGSLHQFARRLVDKHGELPRLLAVSLCAGTIRAEEFMHRWALWKLRIEDRSWRRRMRGNSATS